MADPEEKIVTTEELVDEIKGLRGRYLVSKKKLPKKLKLPKLVIDTVIPRGVLWFLPQMAPTLKDPDRLKDQKYIYQITLKSPIYQINSQLQLNSFINEFYRGSGKIDWDLVRGDYEGIEINNYDDIVEGLEPSAPTLWFFIIGGSCGFVWGEDGVESREIFANKYYSKWKMNLDLI